jgi:hypothetical protein
VKAGALIVRLEDQEYVNSVRMETNQLNLELMESELRKQESLYEKGGVTLRELKTASINYENAKTTVVTSKLQLEKTKISAPIDGVIVDLPYHTQGTQVEAGVTIVKIMDYKTMYMDVQLPEKYISVIKPGQVVKLTNYTIPDDTIIGNVTQLSPAINADTRTFKGTVSIDTISCVRNVCKTDIVTTRKDSAIVILNIICRGKGKNSTIVDRGVAAEGSLKPDLKILLTLRVTGACKNEGVTWIKTSVTGLR